MKIITVHAWLTFIKKNVVKIDPNRVSQPENPNTSTTQGVKL